MRVKSPRVIVQTCIEGKAWEDVDWRRTAGFMLFGFGYLVRFFLLLVCVDASRVFFKRTAGERTAC